MFRWKSFNEGGDFRWRQFIRLDDRTFVNITSELIRDLDPNGVIQVVVAYKNLGPIVSAGREAVVWAKSEQWAKLSNTKKAELEKLGALEGYIEMFAEDYSSFAGFFGKLRSISRWGLQDANVGREATKRRLLWFLHAAFLMRAEKIAQAAEQCRDKVADAWIHLIQYGTIFRPVLEQNILWSHDDKSWFELDGDPFGMVADEKKSRDFCAQTMPKWLTKNAKMRDYLNNSGMKDWLWADDLMNR